MGWTGPTHNLVSCIHVIYKKEILLFVGTLRRLARLHVAEPLRRFGFLSFSF